MSDEENEPGGDDVASDESTGEGTSIFDAFEPPPDVDPNRFGPVPVISDDPIGEDDDPVGQADDGISIDDLVIVDDDTPPPPRAGTIELDELLGDPDILDDTDLLGDRPRVDDLASASTSASSDAAAPTSSDEPAATSSETESADLPHWTAPATGAVPKVVASDRADDSWQELSGPRWKGEGPDWADDDIAGVLGGSDEGHVVVIDDDGEDAIPPGAGSPQRAAPTPRARPAAPPPDDSDERNIPLAIGVGIAMAAIALAAFRLSGNLWALGLITVVAVLCAVELFDAMRRAGLHPATLLAITAVGAFPLAVYNEGEPAVPLMLGLTVVFGALWYIVGADSHRPALNLGLTFLGVAWLGGLAAFGALILELQDGKSILVAAIIVTVASDTFALAGGKAFGSRPFHSASPNKTWEGTLVGFVAAVGAGAVIGLLEISPFSSDFLHAIYLGVVIGVLAPLGDLTESMIKRDLGVKDMGSLLPGHGGVLDRFDGLLFALPGAYYLALVLDYAFA